MVDGSAPPDTAEEEVFGTSTPAQAVDPDTDAVVRTAAAEAGPGGYGAVANVIRNRADKSGKSFSAVVGEPGAFEGYGNKTYTSLKAGSPQYNAILEEVAPVLSGEQSPVGDADAYYSPKGQAAKGRQVPEWSVGQMPVANVGGNQFYSGVYHASAPSVDPRAEQEVFGANPAYSIGGAPATPIAASPLPVAEVRPQKLEDNPSFSGYDMKGQPVFRNDANPLDLPATDPDLPKAPQGYYWPAGTELGADGKPHIFEEGVADPNQKERFDPAKLANELELERLQANPSGRAALNAVAAETPQDAAAQDRIRQGTNALQSLGGGTFAPLTGAMGYAFQSGDNLINSLTGKPVLINPADRAAAEELSVRQDIAREQALHPQRAALTQLGYGTLGSIPILESGMGAVRAIPGAGAFLAGDAGAGNGLGNFLLRTGSKATAGGLEGTGGALLTSNESNRPLSDQLATGAAFGGALRGGGSLLTDAGRSLLGSANVSPATQNLLQSAADQGINLRAGQMSGSPFIRTLDSELSKMPLTGYAESDAAQRAAFTSAVAKTFGEDATGLTPEVMSRARDRIGQMFDDVASRTSIPDRDGVLTRLGNVVEEASGVLPESELAPLRKQVQNIATSFGDDGTMSGAAYQALTKRNGALDLAMRSSNAGIREYADQMRDVLDDALEANAQPEDLQELRTARLQWKNMRTVQGLAAKSGPDGAISPVALKQAVLNSYKDYAYTGAGDIGNLAEIGQRFIKEPPNSGTAQRLGVRNMLTGGGLLAGGASGMAELLHQPLPATIAGIGALGALATPPITARLLNNPLTRSAFTDSLPVWQRVAQPVLQQSGRVALPAGVQGTNLLLAPPREQPVAYAQ